MRYGDFPCVRVLWRYVSVEGVGGGLLLVATMMMMVGGGSSCRYYCGRIDIFVKVGADTATFIVGG